MCFVASSSSIIFFSRITLLSCKIFAFVAWFCSTTPLVWCRHNFLFLFLPHQFLLTSSSRPMLQYVLAMVCMRQREHRTPRVIARESELFIGMHNICCLGFTSTTFCDQWLESLGTWLTNYKRGPKDSPQQPNGAARVEEARANDNIILWAR
jgi:hypothetical protein